MTYFLHPCDSLATLPSCAKHMAALCLLHQEDVSFKVRPGACLGLDWPCKHSARHAPSAGARLLSPVATSIAIKAAWLNERMSRH